MHLSWSSAYSTEVRKWLHIELKLVRPPYHSPWPLRPPTKAQLEAKYGDDDAYHPLWFSVMMWDFHRYVLEPAIRKFLASNQQRYLADWSKKARTALPAAQQRLAELAQQIQRNAPGPIETAEQFVDLLGDEQQMALFQALREVEQWKKSPPPKRFDVDVAARWIFARVLQLGWKPQRFAQYDRFVDERRRDRTAFSQERIGKKYQWIAFHEAVARIADHCLIQAEWDEKAPQPYQGPWEVAIRDIDPSFLVRKTKKTRKVQRGCWWVPVSPTFPSDHNRDNLEHWLKDGTDFPSPEQLMTITDQTGQHWLTLTGHYEWETETPPKVVDRYQSGHCQLWYRMAGYLIHQRDLPSFVKLARKGQIKPMHLPELQTDDSMFLGEYSWHPAAVNAVDDWGEIGEEEGSIPVLIPNATYTRDASKYDKSIDQSIHGEIPSPSLVSGLDLRWHGEALCYRNKGGKVIAWDPSISEPGPSVLLISKEAIVDCLGHQQWVLVWIVTGEKLISEQSRYSIRELSGVFVFQDDSPKKITLTSTIRA